MVDNRTYYRPTRIPSLLLEVVSLREELRNLRAGPATESPDKWSSDAAHLRTQWERMLESANDKDQRANALRAACQLSGVDEGFLLCVNEIEPATWLGSSPLLGAAAWAAERLASAIDNDEDTITQSVTTFESEESARMFEGVHHRLIMLWRSDRGVSRPVGALVLASRTGPPPMPPLTLLQLLGPHLAHS